MADPFGQVNVLEQAGGAEAVPDIFLPYQFDAFQHMVPAANDNGTDTALPLILAIEKSRRIGITWAAAAAAVLTAGASPEAGGQPVYYMGYNLEMARDFIDTCADYARAFAIGAGAVHEMLFEGDDADKAIKAYRIELASFSIVALPSSPRVLRGKQGLVIIDEAAFHDDLDELLKAAVALTMWQGRVVVISTHNGEDNAFNALIQDIRAGRREGRVLRVDLKTAIEQGLYRRICYVTGQSWTAEKEAAWEAELRRAYGAGAEEELDVIPARGGGTPFSRALVEACADADAPVVRYAQEPGFTLLAAHLREAEVRDWCERELWPLLRGLDRSLATVMGVDFGRVVDLSVFWLMQVRQTTERVTPFTIELRNVPYEQQRQILFYVLDRLARLAGVALDATGSGEYLAEVALQRYGSGAVIPVKLSVEWYREHMPPYLAAFQDRTITVPLDEDVITDHRALKRIEGVLRVPPVRGKGADGLERHGDSAIAGALAYFRSRQDTAAYGYRPIARDSGDWDDGRMRMRADERDDTPRWRQGAW